MEVITSRNVINIFINTLNKMNPRLISHGERVAFLMMGMMQTDDVYTQKELRNIIVLSLLHDIGAYEKHEIDNLVDYETSRKEQLPHASYGSVFIKYFTPFPELAAIIQFHHTTLHKVQKLKLDSKLERAILCLQLADCADLYLMGHSTDMMLPYLESQIGTIYTRDVYDIFCKGENRFELLSKIADRGCYHKSLLHAIDALPFSCEELDALLKTVISSIDFRSRHTVFHCTTMARLSLRMAGLFQLNSEECLAVKYGSILHDLGKAAIPVNILESSGKLAGDDWEIMQSHVTLTKEIIEGNVDDAILQIAIRHHEKLDGSGYMQGLCKHNLTLCQRIVAVADITSALLGERSYKEAFTKEKVLEILKDMADCNKICTQVVHMLEKNYDMIYEEIQDTIQETIDIYERLDVDLKRALLLAHSV